MSNMATMVDTLLKRIDNQASQFARMEKTIGDLGKNREHREERIVKTLLARGGGAAVGFGDSETANILEVVSRGRQKSIGMGQDLRAIWVARGGDPGAIGWDGGDVHKHLDAKGFLNTAHRKASLAEASGVTGGYTVAPQFYMNLLKLSVEEAQIRPKCTTIPMNSRTIFIPALDQSKVPATGTSAFLGGIQAFWQPEAASITESDPIFRQLEMTARDLVFICVASNQLLMDNAIGLDSLLSTLFQEAMTWCYDYFILRGNGAGQPQGLLNSPAAYTQVSSGSAVFTQADAAAMWSRLLIQSQKSACWIAHPSVMPQLINMTNGATNSPFLTFLNPAPHSGEGGPIAQAVPLGFMMGLPVIWTEKLPALAAGVIGSVVLADLSKQLVGDRLAIQIESSPYPRFTTNQTVWRIVARWDSQNWLNAPITMADGAYQMSSIVLHKAATS